MLVQQKLRILLLMWLSFAVTVVAAEVSAAPELDEKATARPDDTKYWKDALIPIQDQPGLPRVLLIGDSVSVCYTLATRRELQGEANVHRIPENAGHTGKSLEKIDGWLSSGKWEVIHFNWGLHDLRQGIGTTVEEYEQNLRKLVKKMQATGAKLIWCSITPLPPDLPRSAAGTETLLAYNAVAKKVMDENDIAIDDLYTFARPQVQKLQIPRSAHFTEEGSIVLAKQVAGSIRQALKKSPAAAPIATAPPIKESASVAAPSVIAGGLKPTLGAAGRLLLEEKFEGDALPNGWTVKSGGLRVADGVLRAGQKKDTDGRLGLFSRELSMQDAAIEIDFKFEGARGINISCNPSPGELKKHGHLFSVMITQRMWNITEHNDKADRTSRSKALASAAENFEPGKWYTLLVEIKGDDVVARVEGKKPLRATSKDFRVKKPGIEFRVSGRDGDEVSFDNLRVWELK
jgi:hypothetical protein